MSSSNTKCPVCLNFKGYSEIKHTCSKCARYFCDDCSTVCVGCTKEFICKDCSACKRCFQINEQVTKETQRRREERREPDSTARYRENENPVPTYGSGNFITTPEKLHEYRWGKPPRGF